MNQEHKSAERPFWAKNLVHTCMGVQEGERVLILTDEPLAYARVALLAEALTAKPAELWSYSIPNHTRPLTTLPNVLLQLSKEVEVIILMFENFYREEQFLPSLMQEFLTLRTGGARVASGAWITQDILDHELSADYQQIAAFCYALADWLRGKSSVHITTALGTDLHLSVAGRRWMSDTGLLREPGGGNIPAGEVFVAPLEDSADGVLVVDASLPGLALTEPVRIVFERGRAVSVEGGEGAAFLEQAFKNVEDQPNGEWARVIGEFGIGTNPKARLLGNVLTDEKVLGTIHIALGRNDMWGGNNLAPTHLDGVLRKPTVHIDGELLIEDGKHLVSA